MLLRNAIVKHSIAKLIDKEKKVEKIIVVDFGSQYAHLIAGCIRRLHVFAELVEPDAPTSVFEDSKVKGIVWSGGPASVYEQNAPRVNPEVFTKDWTIKRGVPFLFICYGHQLAARVFSQDYNDYSRVEKAPGGGEYGQTMLTILPDRPLGVLKGLLKEVVLMSHRDEVVALPPDFMLLASTQNCRIAAMKHILYPLFGVQFHPEVTHTSCGMKIFENFLQCCNIAPNWAPQEKYRQIRKEIREKTKDKHVFLLASGGVDSSVLLTILKRTMPRDRIHAFFIDIGISKTDEVWESIALLTGRAYLQRVLSETLPEDVEDHMLKLYKRERFHQFSVIDAKERILKALRDVTDPEEKRNIIGKLFVDVLQEEVQQEVQKFQLGEKDYLIAQGTIYPDTIETARTRHSDRIKTHHNRVRAIEELMERGLIFEPLQFLYKDEVRELGELLGLDPDILYRHPRPGPDPWIEMLCSKYWRFPEFNKQTIQLEQELKALCHAVNNGIDCWITPIKSVGVHGDQRTYAYTAVLTGPWWEIPWDELLALASSVTNRAKGTANRVIALIAPKNFPVTRSIFHKRFPSQERLEMHQVAEQIVNNNLIVANWYQCVWQFPVILVPFGIDDRAESIVLRPIDSVNAMTASVHHLPWQMVEQITQELLALPHIEAVFYDLTSKPPATIEWE